MKATSIILAGGRNKRFGRNKALITIGGQSMIERVMERLTPLTERFLVVTAPDLPDFPAGKAEIIADLYPGSGPLGGIYTGLQASESPLNIVVACDMPFLNEELLNYMLGLSYEVDVIVPKLENGMVEPLHAIYSRSCLPEMKELLESNQLGVAPFLDNVRVRYVQPEESRKLDPELLSFFNINYPSDLDRAIALDSKNVR
ncbi:MAG: molybdenum cofactor guanylyltransferase [Dehalococcoidales bacterium]